MVVSRAARYALFSLFLIPGFGLASWATRTPALRDALGASTQQMGMILFGFSCGAMCGVLSAGWLTHRFGAKCMACAGLLSIHLGLCILALSPIAGSAVLAFLGLFAFGVGIGWAEIAVNIEAAAVERVGKQQIMTTLHGFFSLGTLAGASLSMATTALQVTAPVHLGIAAAAGIVALAIAIRHMPQLSRMAQESTPGQESGRNDRLWDQLRDPSLLVICYIVLAMALAEGTATDWLPLLMIDGYGFDATMGTQIYVGFTLAMTITRFAGGAFVERVGKVRALYASAVLAALGLALIVASPWPWMAIVAVLAWGIGASLGFPLAISAAADGANPARRVSIAATGGYIGFLVGPPMLGFLGEQFGLRMAMIPVMLAVVMAFVATLMFSRYQAGRAPRDAGALSASGH